MRESERLGVALGGVGWLLGGMDRDEAVGDGDLAAGEGGSDAELLDANAMEDGSSGEGLVSEADIWAELGLGPADDEEEEADDGGELSEDDEVSADSDEGSESEADEVDSEEDVEAEPEQASVVSKGAQARIDELTREKKEAAEALAAERGQREALEAKLAELKAGAGPSEAENAFDGVESLDALAERAASLRRTKQFLIKNLDGFTRQIDGKDVEVTAEDARAWLADTEQKLDEDLPARARFLQASAQLESEARAAYPDMFRAGTELHNLYVASLKQVPGLKRMPHARLVVGDAAVGFQVRSGALKVVPAGQAAPSGKAPAKKAVAPASPQKRAAVSAPKAGRAAVAERRPAAALDSGAGSVEEIAEYILGGMA